MFKSLFIPCRGCFFPSFVCILYDTVLIVNKSPCLGQFQLRCLHLFCESTRLLVTECHRCMKTVTLCAGSWRNNSFCWSVIRPRALMLPARESSGWFSHLQQMQKESDEFFCLRSAERSAQKSVTLNLQLKQTHFSCGQVCFADRNLLVS